MIFQIVSDVARELPFQVLKVAQSSRTIRSFLDCLFPFLFYPIKILF